VVDFGGDLDVFVGDGPVGDPGVDEGHLEVLVTQEGGDGFEAHSPVDGLGAEGVTQLVGVDMADPGSFGDPANHPGDPMPVNGADVVGEEPAVAGDMDSVVGLPPSNEFDQVGMERNIPVVAEFPDWDMQPVVFTDTNDRVGGQVGEFPNPHPGAGQQQHTQFAERVRFDVGLVHELGHGGVV